MTLALLYALAGCVALALALRLLGTWRGRVAGNFSVTALAVLVLVPSSEVADGLPAGSIVPIVAAAGILAVGLLRVPLRRPPLLGSAALFVSIMVAFPLLRGSLDPFYALIGPIGLAFLLLAYSADSAGRRTIRRGIVLLGVIEAVLAIAEAATGSGPLLGDPITMTTRNPYLPGLLRAQGTLAHPIVLSALLTVALGLVLLRTGTLHTWWTRFPIAALLAVGSLATGSSSALITAGFIGAAWLLHRSKAGTILLAAQTVATAAVMVLVKTPISQVLESDLNPTTASHRINSISAIPDLLTQRNIPEVLFGSGSVEELYRANIMVDVGFYAVDNQAVYTLATLGLSGALAGTWLAVRAFVIATPPYRIVLLTFGLLTLTFDFLNWYVTATLLFTILGLGANSSDLPGGDSAEADQRRDRVLGDGHRKPPRARIKVPA